MAPVTKSDLEGFWVHFDVEILNGGPMLGLQLVVRRPVGTEIMTGSNTTSEQATTTVHEPYHATSTTFTIVIYPQTSAL